MPPESRTPVPTSSGRSRIAGIGIPFLALAAGLLLAFYPTLLSGFQRIQTDPGETRMNHYFLEHTYLCLLQAPGHRSFWDPPFFYPHRNSAAYSDVLLGVAPVYWAFRPLLAPDTAFQAWMLAVSILNFLAAYLLLRKGLECSPAAAAFGSLLFAFGSPRMAQLGHHQLLGQFYTPLAVHAVVRLFALAECPRSFWRRAGWVLVGTACAVGQLYSAYYLGWFLGVGALVAGFWTLVLPEYRRPLLRVLLQNAPVLILAGALAALALWPMVEHYRAAAAEVAKRKYIDAFNSAPPLGTWLYHGEESWLYARLSGPPPGGFESEERLGIGLLTLGMAFLGLWRSQARPAARLALLVALTAVLYAAMLGNNREFCRWHFDHVPGAYGIRMVPRVVFLTLLPAALGCALFLDRLRQERSLRLVLAACLLGLIEQGRFHTSYDKQAERAHVARLAAHVDRSAAAFLLTPTRAPSNADIDGMWLERATGVPTINGYSGNQPPGWKLLNTAAGTPKERAEVETRLGEWLDRCRLDRRKISWVVTDMSDESPALY